MRFTVFLISIIVLSGCTSHGDNQVIDELLTRGSEPNILIVTFDSLRPDRISAYGYGLETTPNIDELAAESLVFTDNYAQCGSTLCSLPSLFTSKYPYVDNPLEETFLTDFFKKEGYTTMAVASNTFSQSMHTKLTSIDYYADDYPGFGTGQATKKQALELLEKTNGSKFFLWVHFREPHRPYLPSRKSFMKFYLPEEGEVLVTDFQEDDLSNLDEANHYFMNVRGEGLWEYGRGRMYSVNLTPSALSQVSSLYDGLVHEADAELGEILDYLREKRLYENTIIVVAADHADSLGENGYIGHNYGFPEILHTPLIIRIPGGPVGVRDYPVMNIDIMPTILSAINASHNLSLRGVDIRRSQDSRRMQYAGYAGEKAVKKGELQLMLYRLHPEDNIMVNTSAKWRVQENLMESMPGKSQEILDEMLDLEYGVLDGYGEDTLQKLRDLGYIR